MIWLRVSKIQGIFYKLCVQSNKIGIAKSIRVEIRRFDMRFFLILFFAFSTTALASTDYTVWVNEYDEKLVFIEGLKEDLFKKYNIKYSRGPKWGTNDTLYKVLDTDLYERASYWSESGYPYGKCPGFTERDFEYADEEVTFSFTWESIKKVEGSKKTVFYLAQYNIEFSVNGKTCKYVQRDDQKYVFLNKLDENGLPIYLGELSTLPRQ